MKRRLTDQNRASWDRECGRSSHPLFAPEELKRWVVICPRQMEREMKQLVARMIQFGQNMSFNITQPKWYDSIETNLAKIIIIHSI